MTFAGKCQVFVESASRSSGMGAWGGGGGVNCGPLHKRNLANSRGRAKKVRDPPLRGSSRVLGGEAARARVSGVRLHCERQESSGFGSVSLRRGCVGVFDACCELRLVPGASAHLEQSFVFK